MTNAQDSLQVTQDHCRFRVLDNKGPNTNTSAAMDVSIQTIFIVSAAHRLLDHPGKCRHIHGHNYKITVTLAPLPQQGLDSQGMVTDFSNVKKTIGTWLSEKWDHSLLLGSKDPLISFLSHAGELEGAEYQEAFSRLYVMAGNPTAENMALSLLENLGPIVNSKDNVLLCAVKVEETEKCSALATIDC